MGTDVLIVGAGLGGLYAAYRLQQAGVDYQLFEARERLGGRVQGRGVKDGTRDAVYDLGPSWVWPDFQPLIEQLLRELGLSIFEQYLAGDRVHEEAAGDRVMRSSGPSAMRGSFRIAGGTPALIDALAAGVPAERIHLSSPVSRLQQRDEHIRVYVDEGDVPPVKARRIILSLPPRLIARSLTFDPPLPEGVREDFIGMPTWMAGHAKVIALYDRAFWREQGLSGDGFSDCGPMTEIHDASPMDGGPYALFGFVGYPPDVRHAMGDEALLAAARQQLHRLFGPEAARPREIFYRDWAQEPYTSTVDDLVAVQAHPEYGLPQGAHGLWAGRLLFATTEVAAEQGGYLEGALVAADQALMGLLK